MNSQTSPKGQEIEVRGEKFVLLPEGALFWPQTGILAVADFHLGKAQTFGLHGYPLPDLAQRADLSRLLETLRREGAQELVFLGDLVHSREGMNAELEERLAVFIEAFGGPVSLIAGNHDRGLVRQWPQAWSRLKIREELEIDGFVFRHEPPTNRRSAATKPFVWAGHVHPCVRLAAGPDRLRLKTFVLRAHYGILPAFSSLAGGYDIRPDAKTKLFPIGDGAVREL